MALEWQPRHPDYFPQRRRPDGGSSPINLDPIPIPPPPTELTWQPHFPAQISRRQLPVAAYSFYVSGSPFLGTAFRTPPSYPSQVLRPRLRQYSESFEVGGMIALPAIAGWRPRYPDLLRRARRPALGYSSWVVDPTTLLNAAACVTWNDISFTNPALTPEDLSQPSFIDEDLINPDLVDEGIC